MRTYAELYEHLFSKLNGDFLSISNFLKKLPGKNIAEIGAATGRTLSLYNDMMVTLIEPDTDMFKVLEQKTSHRKNVNCIQANSFNLPFTDDSLDGILFPFMVISEATPIYFTIKEALRVLKENGKIYIWEVDPNQVYAKSNSTKSLDLPDAPMKTFDTKTINIPSLGPYEFETYFRIRGSLIDQCYTVKQVIPPKEFYIQLFEHFELEVELIETKCFTTNNDKLIFTLQKKPKQSSLKKDIETTLVQNLYNELAPQYSKKLNLSSYAIDSWIPENLKAYINLSPRVLDLGCGDGRVANILDSISIKPIQMFGFDISQKMVEIAEKNNLYTGIGVYDLNKGIPIIKNFSFDLITCFGVTEFLSNIQSLILQIKNLLTIGGEALISFNATEELKPERPLFLDSGISLFKYNESEVKKLISDAGLDIVSFESLIGYKSFTTNESTPYFIVRVMRTRLQ